MHENDRIGKLVIDDTVYETVLTAKYMKRKPYTPPNPNKIIAFIPGNIREIYVKVGQKVKKGDKLLILEAMKMKNTIYAEFDCSIKNIVVFQDQQVAKNQLIMELE